MHQITGAAVEGAALRYLQQAQPVYDDLRRLLTQLSGFSLMLMTSSRRQVLLEETLFAAAESAASTAEAVRALLVPSGAHHHYHHLSSAAQAISDIFRAVRIAGASGASDGDRDRLVKLLKSAVEHLRVVSRLLPGFEPVNFDQACCAMHAGIRPPEWQHTSSEGENYGGLLDLGVGTRSS